MQSMEIDGDHSAQEDHWIPLSDLMTGLMAMFLLISVLYMIEVETDARQIKDVAVAYTEIRDSLYDDLMREFGPDLADVAAFAAVTEAEAVRLHTSRVYRVFMLGFMPGFPYMGIVDQRIAAPRLSTPRVRVPVGSVGIAGMQTGIYSVSTPGGWRIIGRTPLKPFDVSRGEPALFKPGDAVQFYAIDPGEYARFESAC